jgi:hypothetical protein
VGVLVVWWEKESTVSAGDYNFFYGKANENSSVGSRFIAHHRIL